MSILALPTSAAAKRRIPWTIALFVAIAAVGVYALIATLWRPRVPGILAGEFHTVAPTDLDVTISKDGELQAVNNVDIANPVEGSSVVLDIAKEGAYVHKGDIVVRIDDKD